jgi:hypothetical protein
MFNFFRKRKIMTATTSRKYRIAGSRTIQTNQTCLLCVEADSEEQAAELAAAEFETDDLLWVDDGDDAYVAEIDFEVSEC